jgi:hypothetical protein
MMVTTIHDLMVIAGVDGYEPRCAYRDATPDAPPYVEGQTFDAAPGETFTLIYDDGVYEDGASTRAVRVTT